MNITKRTVVRYLSFSMAAVLVMGGFALKNKLEAQQYKTELENGYARSLRELSSYLTVISNDLDKGRYINSPMQYSQMSARIFKASGSAKSALSALPVSDLHMDNTYRFLSQVGDYSMAISKKLSNEETMTPEEMDNAKMLQEYAQKLREQVDTLSTQIESGQLNVAAMQKDNNEGNEATGGLSESFENLEQTMTGYPTLIYDGPFSDQILTQKPRLLEGKELVPAEKALTFAGRASGSQALKWVEDENSMMPSYIFAGGDITVGVTKAGGYVTYMINSRAVGEQTIDKQTAFDKGSAYLDKLGIKNMRPTYFEIQDGICTINYASTQGDIILYTDLVKVGVAMDNGEVVSFDSRGYISNHYEREPLTAQLTVEQAMEKINPNLSVQDSKLALIPTGGKNEVLTYEFLVLADEEQKLLVYINANTGTEEHLLILIETPNGTLTR